MVESKKEEEEKIFVNCNGELRLKREEAHGKGMKA